MKFLVPFLGFLTITSTFCLASFSINEITEWDEMEKLDFDLRIERIEPSSTIERIIPYYRFTLTAPVTLKGRQEVDLRIDFWKDKRSTEVPIQLSSGGPGKKRAHLSISEKDLEPSAIVVRYGSRNTSAEYGYRLHLKDLIEKKKAE